MSLDDYGTIYVCFSLSILIGHRMSDVIDYKKIFIYQTLSSSIICLLWQKLNRQYINTNAC